jgi:hypothetical protein
MFPGIQRRNREVGVSTVPRSDKKRVNRGSSSTGLISVVQ